MRPKNQEPEGESEIVWDFCDPRRGARASAAASKSVLGSQVAGCRKDQQVDALMNLMKRGKQRRQQQTETLNEPAASPKQPRPPTLLECWQPRVPKVPLGMPSCIEPKHT